MAVPRQNLHEADRILDLLNGMVREGTLMTTKEKELAGEPPAGEEGMHAHCRMMLSVALF